MSNKNSITIISNIDGAIDGSNKSIEKANLSIAMRVVAEAKSLATGNVDTGRLRNSIQYNVNGIRGGLNDSSGEGAEEMSLPKEQFTGYVGVSANYGAYVEFGTRKSRPFPYLRPAIAIVKNPSSLNTVLDTIRKETAKGSLTKTKKRERFF